MPEIRLTPSNINSLPPRLGIKAPTLYGDGNGLYLQVTPASVRSWIFRYTFKKRTRSMGLGPLRALSLDAARKRARELRVMLDRGQDPLEVRAKEEREQEAAANRSRTFRQCARDYLDDLKGSLRNAKHYDQWVSTLTRHAYPVIGDMPVNDIAEPDVLKVIDPLFKRIPETARRVCGRIEKILAWCIVRGLRTNRENPARWKGHLSEAVPKASQKMPAKHHKALDYKDMPAFMAEIQRDGSDGSLLLQFLIFNWSRTLEARAAMWSEIDFETKRWTIDAARMKGHVEHCVPLSEPALAILSYRKKLNDSLATPSIYVFPGRKPGTPLSDAAAAEFLKRIGRTSITVHGMRACARSWGADTTDYSREVLEHALAHRIKDKTEAAYNRVSMLDKRAKLMADWATYCLSAVGSRKKTDEGD